RARPGLTIGERLDAGLHVPGIVVAAFHPRPADPHRARARQPADLGAVARPEDEILETFGPGDERVLGLVGAVDDTVERTDLVPLAVLPRQTRAGEDEEDLLGGAVRVRRRRQLPGRDPDAVDADALRARGVAEALPDGVHLALRPMVGL